VNQAVYSSMNKYPQTDIHRYDAEPKARIMMQYTIPRDHSCWEDGMLEQSRDGVIEHRRDGVIEQPLFGMIEHPLYGMI